MSLDLGNIADILREHLADEPDKLNAIIKDLVAVEKQVSQENAAAEKTPRAKSKYVVLVRGDAALQSLVAGGAWIVKVDEDNDTSTLLDRIYRSVREFNDSLRGNRRASRLIRNFARAMEYLRPKAILRAEGAFKVVTKMPVEVMVVEKEEAP